MIGTTTDRHAAHASFSLAYSELSATELARIVGGDASTTKQPTTQPSVNEIAVVKRVDASTSTL